MQPYVIKQGDTLALIAYRLGFDADTVWNDAKNATLRQARPSPNILFPSDILYVPDQIDKPPAGRSLVPGATNSFVSDPPTVTVTHQFVGTDPSAYASQAYAVAELPDLTGLTTDATGMATFAAPITLATATVTFTASGESWALQLGEMDPVNTLPGIYKRLQNLMYIGSDTPFDPTNLNPIRAGLQSLRAWQGSLPVPADSVQGSDPSAPVSSSSPPPSAPASAPASSPNTAPEDASADADDADDGSGLAADGTLDPTVAALLVKVHGC